MRKKVINDHMAELLKASGKSASSIGLGRLVSSGSLSAPATPLEKIAALIARRLAEGGPDLSSSIKVFVKTNPPGKIVEQVKKEERRANMLEPHKKAQ